MLWCHYSSTMATTNNKLTWLPFCYSPRLRILFEVLRIDKWNLKTKTLIDTGSPLNSRAKTVSFGHYVCKYRVSTGEWWLYWMVYTAPCGPHYLSNIWICANLCGFLLVQRSCMILMFKNTTAYIEIHLRQ